MHEALLPRWVTLTPLVAVAYVVNDNEHAHLWSTRKTVS